MSDNNKETTKAKAYNIFVAKPKKSDKITISIPKLIFPFIFLVVLMTPVIILARENERMRKQELTRVFPTPTPMVSLTPTPTSKPTTKPAVKTNEPTANPWLVEKIDEKTTDARMPRDERMATADELFTAINNYRTSHGVGSVEKHQTLCNIAQTRANQLLELGELDSHAGMKSLAKSQLDFDNMGEILQGGVQPNLAVHLVEWGWGRSLTGHKESMLDRKWTHGCGGIAGYFSVFIFGSN